MQPFAISCLRIVSLGFVFYAFGMVLTQSFNGAGDTWTPTLINLVVFWLFEIPLAWLLAVNAGFGPVGVFIAHDDRLLGARRRQRGGLSDGEVEGEERLGAHGVRTVGAHVGCSRGCSHRGSGGHPLFNIDLTTRASRFGSIRTSRVHPPCAPPVRTQRAHQQEGTPCPLSS